MKVLIADKLAAEAVAALEQLGLTVECKPDLSADDLPGAISDAGVLVVRSTKVTAATIEAGEALSLIIRAGAGVNTIDLAAASDRGVYVANCPGKNTAAVAELAIGLLIAADRRIVNAASDLRGGAWRKKEYGKSHGLAGRTLGILGFGAIGKATARRAAGLEMRVIAWSRSLTTEIAEQHGVEYADSPEALAAEADAVSVHMAMTPETKHMVDKAFLGAMKDGAILVNTSRGGLIDTEALTAAIAEKNLRVGLDVFEDEPTTGEADFPPTALAAEVTCTPHIGASTNQAAEAVAAEVVRIVEVFLATGKPAGSVNLCVQSRATHNLVLRHLNRVGVLASVLDALRGEDINVEEVENIVFETGKAACCTMRLDQAPSPDLMASLRANDKILHTMIGPITSAE